MDSYVHRGNKNKFFIRFERSFHEVIRCPNVSITHCFLVNLFTFFGVILETLFYSPFQVTFTSTLELTIIM